MVFATAYWGIYWEPVQPLSTAYTKPSLEKHRTATSVCRTGQPSPELIHNIRAYSISKTSMGGFTKEKGLRQGQGALGGDGKAEGAPSKAALWRAHFTDALF